MPRCAYLGSLDDAGSRALAVAQYDAADNMTDAIAALAAIKDSDAPERHELFARFEARWRDEPLVLDKWFALEATAQRKGTLARVRSLLAHPRFNARNPNRVRSLVGSFAHRNFAAFHAPTAPATRSSPSRCSRSTRQSAARLVASPAPSPCGSASASRAAR